MLTCFGVNRQGAQGAYDGASKGILESEFGTSVDDEVIKQILEKGTLQESQVCLFLFGVFVSLLGGAYFSVVVGSVRHRALPQRHGEWTVTSGLIEMF